MTRVKTYRQNGEPQGGSGFPATPRSAINNTITRTGLYIEALLSENRFYPGSRYSP